MEQFSAAVMYSIARSFEKLRSNCNLQERLGVVRFSGAEAKPENMESIELLGSRTIREITPNWKDSFSEILKTVEMQCGSIGLDLAVQAAKGYRKDLDSGRLKSYTDVEAAITTLDKILTLQLRENLFMFVPSDRAPFFSQAQLFGETVNRKFPRCQYDIGEAGSCYAAGRGTAVAFHLMRVMETTVQEFGIALGITLVHEKDWHNILDEINKAIRNLPGKDARTIALSQVAGNLYNVKVAWRNPTMHPKITYTLDEAKDLLWSVKAFTCELAEVL